MHRSAVILGGLCAVLACTTAFVSWRLFSDNSTGSAPLVGGASVSLGLPGLGAQKASTEFTAESALLFDTNSQSILFEQNAFERRPIASITKLMTAMVALDHGIPWEKEMTIEPEEYVQGGRLLLHSGESVTVRDLFAASLVGSANNATLAYVRALDIPKEEFVREMNRKAIELGLDQTQFADVTGLNTENISTAYEVARLASVAFSQYPEISETSSLTEYHMIARGSEREHTIRNTNKLISEEGESFFGSKTGYLYEAGYCLVSQGTGEQANRIAVVLGSPSAPQHFADIKRLLYMVVP